MKATRLFWAATAFITLAACSESNENGMEAGSTVLRVESGLRN